MTNLGYIRMQERVGRAYRDRAGWIGKAILNVARSGKFSSDRTIQEYATDIWHVEACPVAPHSDSGDITRQDISALDAVLQRPAFDPVQALY